MSVFDFIFMALPVVFLISSVLIAVRAVSLGKNRKRTMLMQLASFAAVFAICMVCPFAVSAATGDPGAAAAASEDPKAFGKAIIFVALGEGIALYGMLISIMILSKIG